MPRGYKKVQKCVYTFNSCQGSAEPLLYSILTKSEF